MAPTNTKHNTRSSTGSLPNPSGEGVLSGRITKCKDPALGSSKAATHASPRTLEQVVFRNDRDRTVDEFLDDIEPLTYSTMFPMARKYVRAADNVPQLQSLLRKTLIDRNGLKPRTSDFKEAMLLLIDEQGHDRGRQDERLESDLRLRLGSKWSAVARQRLTRC